MKKDTIIILILGMLSIYSYAQEMPFILKKLNNSIKLDGKLDDVIWEDLEPFNKFYKHYPIDTGLVEKPIIAKAFHDGNTIFMGVSVKEDSPEYIVQSLKRDEGYDSFLNGDGFGIILDVAGEQNSGYLFAVNIKGAQTDGIISISNDGYTVDSNWNTKWESKTSIDSGHRYYEIAIPLNALPHSENNKLWNINLVSNDAKTPQYSTLTSYSRNYSLLDLRFTRPIKFQDLVRDNGTKLTLIPSTVYSYTNDVINNKKNEELTAGLDVKYNITPSLKLEATINPDFSVIEQDEQITNLTRFDISFPEKRNFFLENGDLFNNLGSRGVNPFYSRIVGSTTDIQFGLKLSGKISNKFRVGLLNAQTESTNTTNGQNYTVAVGRRRISNSLTTTIFLVNRQELNKHKILNNYNRVTGVNLNYISKNNLWLGQFSYAKSISSGVSKNNDFFNTTISYSTRQWIGVSSTSLVNKNYITDVGFEPRLHNFDAIINQSKREGYLENYSEIIYNNYHLDNLNRDRNEHKIRFNSFLNSKLELIEEGIEIVNIWKNQNQSYYFLNLNYNYNNLQYPTDILNNGKSIPKAIYNTSFIRIGYISPPTNKAFSFQNRLQYGTFYNGNRLGWELVTNYRLQPWANLSANYNLNVINLKQYGKDTLHTINFTASIFFNNKISWTNIVQLNTQNDNFGFNSRLQWELSPLSFANLVITDNYSTDEINREHFGIALKLNYWLDL